MPEECDGSDRSFRAAFFLQRPPAKSQWGQCSTWQRFVDIGCLPCQRSVANIFAAVMLRNRATKAAAAVHLESGASMKMHVLKSWGWQLLKKAQQPPGRGRFDCSLGRNLIREVVVANGCKQNDAFLGAPQRGSKPQKRFFFGNSLEPQKAPLTAASVVLS